MYRPGSKNRSAGIPGRQTDGTANQVATSPANPGNEVFPLRINLKPLRVFDPPVVFKPLIPELKFITNKKMWSGHIRGQAMREIPEEDYL